MQFVFINGSLMLEGYFNVFSRGSQRLLRATLRYFSVVPQRYAEVQSPAEKIIFTGIVQSLFGK